MPLQHRRHPLLEFFQRTISFGRVTFMMNERNVAARVTTFQSRIKMVSINRSLALHRKIKFRELHRQLTDRAQTKVCNRNSRQKLGDVGRTGWSADHLVGLKCKFGGDNETVRICLMMGWVEYVSGFDCP